MKKTKLLMLFLVIGLIVGLFVGCIPTIPTNSTNLEGEDKSGLKVEANVDPKNGLTPLTVQCVGFVSGGSIPYTYQWEFGDGNWSEKGSGIEHRNLFYIYTEPDEYEPILHVEDSTGKRGSCKAGIVKVITKKPFSSGDEFPLGSNFKWEAIDVYDGPGPNYFSSSIENVWLDEQDRLHLKIVYNGLTDRWECASVVSIKEGWGYGKYTFEITDVIMETINKKGEISYCNKLDENVVIGLYTYDKSTIPSHNEIDIEFGRWGAKNAKLGHFVVWYDGTEQGNYLRNHYPFRLELVGKSSIHSFEWNEGNIQFDSTEISKPVNYPEDKFEKLGTENEGYNYIPEPNKEQVCMNIWLTPRKIEGGETETGEPYNISGIRKVKSAEVIISNFEFIPNIVDNHPPVIDHIEISPIDIYITQPVTITYFASDQDGDTLSYTWTKTGGTFEGSVTGPTITWIAPSKPGNYTVTCEVSDGKDNVDEQLIISVGDVSETYTITASAGLNGSIDPSGEITVNRGSSQSFIITPEVGYHIGYVLIDGISIGAVTSYTFKNVREDHAIAATFSLNAYYVPEDFDTIQAAINAAANGDTVIVNPGIYYENIDFMGKNITLRSTSPNDPSVVESTIIDGSGSGRVVTFSKGETNQAVLSGFTIRGGNTTGDGGGIYIFESNPTITGNTITGNSSHSGAGIYIYGGYTSASTAIITGNTISDNEAAEYSGGGIMLHYCHYGVLISNNVITGNISRFQGAGIYLFYSSPIISGNTISDNNAYGYGGGIYMYMNCKPTIIGNTITGNWTHYYGGGIDIATFDDPNNPTIGGIDEADTDNFNTICGNSPDQVRPNSYPYNYIYNVCP